MAEKDPTPTPPSPPPPVPKVEVRPRAYDDMASVLGLDPDTTDPTRHYRWVNRSHVKVARAKMRGYQLVKKNEVQPYIDVETGPDGAIVAGDLVLMSTDKATFARRKQKEVDLAISRTSRAGDDTLQRGKKLGIKTIRDVSDD